MNNSQTIFLVNSSVSPYFTCELNIRFTDLNKRDRKTSPSLAEFLSTFKNSQK